MAEVVLREDVLGPRIARLKAAWEKEPEKFGNADALSVVYGKQPKDADAQLVAAHVWLLEFQFPDTLIVLTHDRLFFVSSPKKVDNFLVPLKARLESGGFLEGVEVILLRRPRVPKGRVVEAGPSDPGWAAFEEVAGACGSKVGVLGAPPTGDDTARNLFVKSWEAALAARSVGSVECGAEMRRMWERKDTAAQLLVRQAAVLASRTLAKKLQEDLTDALDKGKKVTHAQLSRKADAVLDDPSQIRVTAPQERCDFWFSPLAQSGGKYNTELRRDSQPDDAPVSPDVVLLAVGGAVQSHYALCARSIIIDPTPKQMSLYKALLEAHNTLLNSLVPGAVIGPLVQAALAKLQAAAPPGSVLPSDLGHGIGLSIREKHLDLKPDSKRTVEPGMTFAVVTRIDKIPRLDKAAAEKAAINSISHYSFLLADTVAVITKEDAAARKLTQANIVFTTRAHADPDTISFDYAEDEEEEEEDEEEEEGEEDEEEEGRGRRGRKGRGGGGEGDGDLGAVIEVDEDGTAIRRSARQKAKDAENEGAMDAARKRAYRQMELLEALIQRRRKEVARKLKGGEALDKEAEIREREMEAARPIVSYASAAMYPRDALPTRIMVDKARETVLLPIRGTLVPFHVATIRDVQREEEEGGRHVLKFHFYTPGNPNKQCVPAMVKALREHDAMPFIKMLTFKAKTDENFAVQYRIIRDMQKRLRDRVAHARDEATTVKQAPLVIDRGARNPRISNVSMWPAFGGKKKCVGDLEAHVNGLRFRDERGEIVDVIYKNIRHAIFQPCKQEHIVLLHFHLHDAIMVGRKRVKDVQFFAEAVESSMALDQQQRSSYDPDELAQEARERELRKKLNAVFRDFAKRVQAKARSKPEECDLEFDAPDDSFKFQAATSTGMTTFAPTRDALVSLVARPPVVISVDDLEHVHFERVIVTSRSFDLVLFYKPTVEHKDGFVRLTAIQADRREAIEDWLTFVVELTYTMGSASIGWGTLVKALRDPSFYFSEDEYKDKKPAGWKALIDTDDEDEEEDKESSYESESFGEEEEEDDDDDFDDAVEDEEDDDDDEEEFDEDEEDEEADWDALEKEAAAHDKKRWGETKIGVKRGSSKQGGGKPKRRR